MTDKLLTAEEVAELLNVPIGWVREHTRSGAIPCVLLGRYRRYVLEDVLAWVESLKSGGGPQLRKHAPKVPA
jgi:excisionase family DNA binding protein